MASMRRQDCDHLMTFQLLRKKSQLLVGVGTECWGLGRIRGTSWWVRTVVKDFYMLGSILLSSYSALAETARTLFPP